MQDMNATLGTKQGIRFTCATCGGDPGGLVWQGAVLQGSLTAADIAMLMPTLFNARTAGHLFTSGKLRGSRVGKCWSTTASDFIEDWDRLQRSSSRRRSTPKPRRAAVVEVKRRG